MELATGELVRTYGYWILFLLVGAESMGIPLPGETALVTAAAFAALGHLSITGVILTASVAAIVGDNAGYWIGRTGGLALVRRYGRRLRINERHLDRAHAFFKRHGGKTVFIGRFVAVLRTWAAVLAGAARMPYGTFTFYNAAGGIVWSVVFGMLGYTFGQNLPLLNRYLGEISVAAAVLTLIVAAIALLRRYRREIAGWLRDRSRHRIGRRGPAGVMSAVLPPRSQTAPLGANGSRDRLCRTHGRSPGETLP